MFSCMRCGHLRADARLAVRYDGIGEADDVYAVREEALRELGGELRVAEHDRHDRMFAGYEIESGCGHSFPEVRRVLPQARPQVIARLENVENAHGCRGQEGRDAVREQIGTGALAQPCDDFLATGRIATSSAAARLAVPATEIVYYAEAIAEFVSDADLCSVIRV